MHCRCRLLKKIEIYPTVTILTGLGYTRLVKKIMTGLACNLNKYDSCQLTR